MHLESETCSPKGLIVNDIVVRLFRGLEYRPEDPISDDNPRYQALRTDFVKYDNGAPFDSLCRLAANSAEVSFSSSCLLLSADVDEHRFHIPVFQMKSVCKLLSAHGTYG